MERIELVAREFSRILTSWLTADEMAQVIKDNASESNKSICHSHDYCDANQAMINAVDSIYPELNFLSDLPQKEREETFVFVDAAWSMAKVNNFYI